MTSTSSHSTEKKKDPTRLDNGSSAASDIPAVSRTLGSIRPERELSAIPTKAISNVVASNESTNAHVTRHGAPKMTFLPKRPVRRNVLPENTAQPSLTAESSSRTRGRGFGGGPERGRGGGIGRGETVMVASGPFSLGPAAAGSSVSYGRRSQTSSSSVGLHGFGTTPQTTGLTNKPAPTLVKDSWGDADGNLSSDEGAEKVDMDYVAKLDWNAPMALRREKEKRGKEANNQYRGARVKVEHEPYSADDRMDLSNALDLSESEDEEQPEDLVEYFTNRNVEQSSLPSSERLFIFQFPSPFPAFTPPTKVEKAERQNDGSSTDVKGKGKAVSWASDLHEDGGSVKVENNTTSAAKGEATLQAEGVIGKLEIYKSGAVKMRLNGNLVMDVIPGTQPAFLQSIVYHNRDENRLGVLGDIKKRFVVSPDVDTLLDDFAETQVETAHDPILEGLEPMHIDVDS